ncbi:uncharacterized protein LOC110119061 [Ceratitis capitata]|uniref:uncharacterized protein LOC110119061 n=1 Tax=Ceratitis capitata TaxID=7213 RepID=UPI000A1025C2|nr:uncharacterized protein LOC110119061 [Ceratitis capitata]
MVFNILKSSRAQRIDIFYYLNFNCFNLLHSYSLHRSFAFNSFTSSQQKVTWTSAGREKKELCIVCTLAYHSLLASQYFTHCMNFYRKEGRKKLQKSQIDGNRLMRSQQQSRVDAASTAVIATASRFIDGETVRCLQTMDSMQLCLCQRVAQQHRESKSVSGVE